MSLFNDSFILPFIWENDDEMYNLMQPIRRPKHIDPETYHRKVEFWSDLILDYIKCQRILVVSQGALKKAFTRYFPDEGIKMTPQCLNEVFEEYQANSVISSYQSKFGLSNIAITAANYLVKKPLEWAISYAFGYTSTDDDRKQSDDTLFAFPKVAHQISEGFIAWFNAQYASERLVDKKYFVYELEAFENALETYFVHVPSREYVRTLVMNVYHCVSIQRVSTNDKMCTADIVRVSSRLSERLPAYGGATNCDAETESAVLAGLAQLRKTIKRQEQEEQKLNESIDERRLQVKALVVAKKMTEAKRVLRRTKLMEQALAKKQAQLHNLEAMQLQLDSASDNQTVLRTLSDSSRAMRQAMDSVGGLPKLEETMHDIADGLQDANEISDIISSMGHISLTEGDLEDELASLVAPDQRPKKSTELSDSSLPDLQDELSLLRLLPDVPSSHVPSLDGTEEGLALHVDLGI